jgi:hypothetical protein
MAPPRSAVIYCISAHAPRGRGGKFLRHNLRPKSLHHDPVKNMVTITTALSESYERGQGKIDSAAPQIHLPICAGGQQPRLPRDPLHLQNTKSVLHGVSPEDLERNDERIRHQVVVDPRMENLYRAVIRRRGKQRIRWMEVERSNRPGMVPAERISRSTRGGINTYSLPEYFVWLVAQL